MSFSVRIWQPEDFRTLEWQVQAYLSETAEHGYDVIPSIENAHMMVLIGLMHASVGDPVVLADDGFGQISGWTCWVGQTGNLDLRYHTCIGMGTWVLPVYRRQGVSKQMHEVAAKMAADRGYLAVDRFVSLHGPGRDMLARGGWETFGHMMRRRL